jgi:signal transduction histidine kinase
VSPQGDDPPGSPRSREGSPPLLAPIGPRAPLTKRLTPRYWAVLDYLAGAVTAVILFVVIMTVLARQGLLVPIGAANFIPLSLARPLVALLAAVTGLAVALRRRRPVFMLGVLLVGSLAATALTAPDVRASALIYFLPVAYVLYLVAASYKRRRNAVRILAAVYVTVLADIVLMTLGGGSSVGPAAVISVTLCLTIAWTIGYSVRQRRRYAVRLQDEAASKAVAQERLRIARELHDVVAHSMSVIAVQAGYGQYVIDSQPGDARTALGAIQATSREALYEMRQMLGALRQADEGEAQTPTVSPGSGPGGGSGTGSGAGAGSGASGSGTGAGEGIGHSGGSAAGGAGAPLFPAPGLADLDRLVSRTASAGVQVEVKRLGQPRDLPASIDLSAYRIVQEALTNVVKHAQTSFCQVMIGYGDEELTIVVSDNGAGVPVPEMAGAGMIHHPTGSRNRSTLLARNGSSARGVATLAGAGTRRDDSLTAECGFDQDGAEPVLRLGGGGQAAVGASGGGVGAPGGGHGALGGGHGIIGMRERVTLLGGDFRAGPLPGYGFKVSARIPLPATSP